MSFCYPGNALSSPCTYLGKDKNFININRNFRKKKSSNDKIGLPTDFSRVFLTISRRFFKTRRRLNQNAVAFKKNAVVFPVGTKKMR